MISTIVRCMQRPSLLLIEMAWRWCAGIPTLWLLLREGGRIFNSVPLAQTGILQFSLLDQTQSTYEVMRCVELLAPPVYATTKWLAPLLMVIWAIASGVGRLVILCRTDPKIFAIRWNRIGTVIALQAARVVGLSGTLWIWFAVMRWAGDWTIVQPMQGANPDPNIVGYFGMLIIVTLALFTLWAIVSWVFNAAPMLAVAENYGFIRSLIAAFRLGWLRGKLIEINLVLIVVKLALIVLAMVFSSTPLPFETVVSGRDLYGWWLMVLVVYCIASDFFHVVRTAAYVELWRIWRNAIPVPTNQTS
jgi:hypothetical protein